jgi:hypothetical protein
METVPNSDVIRRIGTGIAFKLDMFRYAAPNTSGSTTASTEPEMADPSAAGARIVASLSSN